MKLATGYAGRLRWLTQAEGGRISPPSGPTYRATAHFGDLEELFSVVLELGKTELGANGQAHQRVELGFLFPDKLAEVQNRMAPGTRLYITEGNKTVAECDLI